ncbi:hypothetical protein ACHAQA_000689 [Verticillium albo-atrum]
MRLSKACKALFFIANHIFAAHIPRVVGIPGRIQNENHNDPHDVVQTSHRGRSTHVPSILSALFARQQDGTCKRCQETCTAGTIVDKNDCSRCTRCPPGHRAHSNFKECVKISAEDRNREFSNKKTRLVMDQREWRFWEKKDAQDNEYKKAAERRKDNEVRNKVRRMGRCLPLVALVAGAEITQEFDISDDFFDEKFLEDGALIELWPEDVDIEPWSDDSTDAIFEKDEFVQAWIDYANNNKKKRDAGVADVNDPKTKLIQERENLRLESPRHPASSEQTPDNHHVQSGVVTLSVRSNEGRTDLLVRDPGLEERFFLIAIFKAIALVVTIVARLAPLASRVIKPIRIAVQAGGRTAQTQRKAAQKIAQDKNFKNCLRMQRPG